MHCLARWLWMLSKQESPKNIYPSSVEQNHSLELSSCSSYVSDQPVSCRYDHPVMVDVRTTPKCIIQYGVTWYSHGLSNYAYVNFSCYELQTCDDFISMYSIQPGSIQHECSTNVMPWNVVGIIIMPMIRKTKPSIHTWANPRGKTRNLFLPLITLCVLMSVHLNLLLSQIREP